MSKYNDLQKATTKMREALEEVNELDLFIAAISISIDRWLSDRGVANHFKTKVVSEIWEGFKLQENEVRNKTEKRGQDDEILSIRSDKQQSKIQ